MSPDVILNRMEVKRLEADELSKEQIHENVNSPKHYSSGEIECIDAMIHCFGIEEVQIYAKIAAFKYLWRSKHKHNSDAEDLAKAEFYIRFANGNDPRDKS